MCTIITSVSSFAAFVAGDIKTARETEREGDRKGQAISRRTASTTQQQVDKALRIRRVCVGRATISKLLHTFELTKQWQ